MEVVMSLLIQAKLSCVKLRSQFNTSPDHQQRAQLAMRKRWGNSPTCQRLIFIIYEKGPSSVAFQSFPNYRNALVSNQRCCLGVQSCKHICIFRLNVDDPLDQHPCTHSINLTLDPRSRVSHHLSIPSSLQDFDRQSVHP